ncbi:methionyl-tRNA formyltransferase [Patescibacteria group bacterium]|nr:methionyl-tRNA formyltransferase [Patescibacteria group bacterium]
MKIAFFGTPDFTTQFLDTLVVHDMTPSLVVTNPDRPTGRGMHLTSPAPKLWADNHSVHCIQPEKITEEVLQELSTTDWDLFVVVAYGKILPQILIDMPTFGTINVHYSLLPKYRGATPVESAILNGEETTGVSIQQMRFKLDSGPVLSEQQVSISPTDTTLTLRQKLNDIALELLPQTIEALVTKSVTPKPQDESLATHCGKIQKSDGEILLSDGPVFNDRKFRSHVGNVGSYFYTEKNDKTIRVKIVAAHLENSVFIIDEVIPENGKRQSYAQFLLQ